MSVASIIYVLAVSFQVSGAILLLIYGFSVKRSDIVRQFFTNSFSIQDANTEEIIYDEKAFINVIQAAYVNRFSVYLIAIGYLLGVFGNLN